MRLKIDLHVHTGRYSQCAESLPPAALAERARAVGLAGVVITEHDVLWAEEELEMLQRTSAGVRLFRGIECSAQGAHLVVIGLEDAGELHRGASLEQVAELAHRQHAAVILAHPFRDSDPTGLPLHLVDAVEVNSTSFTAAESRRARALARRLGKPVVASSDAHALSRLGWAWTEFPEMPTGAGELARLISSGVGRPRSARRPTR